MNSVLENVMAIPLATRLCPNCEGSGMETRKNPQTQEEETITCRTCKGRGIVGVLRRNRECAV